MNTQHKYQAYTREALDIHSSVGVGVGVSVGISVGVSVGVGVIVIQYKRLRTINPPFMNGIASAVLAHKPTASCCLYLLSVGRKRRKHTTYIQHARANTVAHVVVVVVIACAISSGVNCS